MAVVAIGLGTNVGDRLGFLQAALDRLVQVVTLEAVSSVYETAPMYVEDQPPFFNAAAIGTSALGPLALLRELKSIEHQLGRATRVRYGPREIDLDLLAYGSVALDSNRLGGAQLQAPHPRTPERRFVLEPLAEIAPEMRLPGLGRVCDLLVGTNVQVASVVRVSDAELSIHGHHA